MSGVFKFILVTYPTPNNGLTYTNVTVLQFSVRTVEKCCKVPEFQCNRQLLADVDFTTLFPEAKFKGGRRLRVSTKYLPSLVPSLLLILSR